MIRILLAMSLFLSPSDPLLKQAAEGICPCHIKEEESQALIDQLYESAKEKPNLVGLAAPQIGILKRIILVDLAATEALPRLPRKMREFINPEILWSEGSRVLIRAYDRECNLVTEEFSDYTARIFQREIDHLDGIYLAEKEDH